MSIFRLSVAAAALAAASKAAAYQYPAGYTTSANEVDMLSCCPGEDSSTQARFVWHTKPGVSCSFLYRVSGASSETAVTPASEQHQNEKWPTAFCIYPSSSSPTNYVNYARHAVALDGLTPGTEYEYRVKAGTAYSATQRFRTAGTSGEFNFLWMSDVHSLRTEHAKMTSVGTLVSNAESMTSDSGGLDFILFSGDFAKYGQRYDCWQEWNGSRAVADYMLAMCVGNHEYYTFPKASVGGTARISDSWFLSMRNDPANGADGIGSSYWFIRDSVMFVSMDTMIGEASSHVDATVRSEALKRQTNWFDRVVSEQEAKNGFQYLVVYQHYPHFTYSKAKTNSETGEKEPAGFEYGSGRYTRWRDLFDKHRVDFALGSDHHNYSRSKQLRGGAEDPQGTVYMTSPEIGTSLSTPSVVSDVTQLSTYGLSNPVAQENDAVEELMASANHGNDANGAVIFSVDKARMTMRYICKESGAVYDQVSVAAKRPPVTREAPADGPFVWTGAADGYSFSRPGNWTVGGKTAATAPGSGSTIEFNITRATTVTNDIPSFAPAVIRFNATDNTTKHCTVAGLPITGVGRVVNSMSVTNKFRCAVTFSGDIDSTGEIDYVGGVTGKVPANHTTYRGKYTLTTTGDWTPPAGSVVPSGSSLSMPNGTFYCHMAYMRIESGATVTAGRAKINRTSDAQMLGENDGVFKTTGTLTSSGTAAVYHYLVETSAEAASSGLVALSGVKIDGSAIVYANSYGGRYQMAVGDNGIKKKAGAAGYFLLRNDSKPQLVGSWCGGNDYKIAVVESDGTYNTATEEYVLYGRRTDRNYNIVFDTSDCLSSGKSNTVRDMTPICGADPAKVSVGVCGTGTFRFENTAVNAPGLYSGGTTVSNSATVAIFKGSCPGRGGLSLRDTATLSIPDSATGTANVFGTLDAGAGTRIQFAALSSGTTPLSVGGLSAASGTKPAIAVNASGLADGTYPLIASSSATAAAAGSFALSASGVASGKSASLVKNGNTLCLKIAASGSGGGGTVVPVGERIVGVWDHYGKGLYKGEVDNYKMTVQNLRSAGITDVFVDYKVHKNVTFDAGGAPVYGSGAKFLRSELTNYVHAAKGSGLRVHAWFACFKGENDSPGIDPADTVHQDYLVSNIVDVARNCGVDGIHLDYCRVVGNVADATNAVTNVTAFVGKVWTNVNEVAESLGRDIALSVAVFPKQDKTHNGMVLNSKGQAWRKWIDDGIVDFVAPMNYASQMEAYIEPDKGSNPGYRYYMETDSDTPEHAAHVVSGIAVISDGCTNDWSVVSAQMDAADAAGLRGYAFFDLTTCDFFRQHILPGLEESCARQGDGRFVWTGSANDGNLFSTPGNWKNSLAPTNGSTLVFSFKADTTLVNDIENLCPGKIEFEPCAFRCSVTGGALSNVVSIVNGASVTNVFRNAVFFTGDIDTAGDVAFAGGAWGAKPANHTTYRGEYHVSDPVWTPDDGSALLSSAGEYASSLFVRTLKNPGTLTVGEGSTVNVEGNAEVAAESSVSYLLARNDGLLNVGGDIAVRGGGNLMPYSMASTGAICAKGLKSNATGDHFKLAAKAGGIPVRWIIGSDGMTTNNASAKTYFIDDKTAGAVVTPAGTSLTIAANIGVRSPLAISTTATNGLPATVRMKGYFWRDGAVSLEGAGVFVLTNSCAAFTGSIGVNDTATLRLGRGSHTGSGRVTVGSGATLALSESSLGTARSAGTLEFCDGAKLVLGGLDAGVVPLSAGTLIIRGTDGHGTTLTVTDGKSAPAPGSYTIIRRTDSDNIIDDHIRRLVIDDPILGADRCVLSIGADGKSIVLTVLAPSTWPSEWNGGSPRDEAMQAAYDEWAKTSDWRAGNAEAAFLMGVVAADYEPLAPTSVVRADSNVSVGVNADLSRANGRPFVLTSATLDAPDGEWRRADARTDAGGRVIINLDGKDPVRFFRIGVGY